MGRQSKYDHRYTLTIVCEGETYRQFRAAVEKKGLSVSSVLNDYMAGYVENRDSRSDWVYSSDVPPLLAEHKSWQNYIQSTSKERVQEIDTAALNIRNLVDRKLHPKTKFHE